MRNTCLELRVQPPTALAEKAGTIEGPYQLGDHTIMIGQQMCASSDKEPPLRLIGTTRRRDYHAAYSRPPFKEEYCFTQNFYICNSNSFKT
eukprot:3848711-Amphidinium_carterae.1